MLRGLVAACFGGFWLARFSKENKAVDIQSSGWMARYYHAGLGEAILNHVAEDQDLISSYFLLSQEEGIALLDSYILSSGSSIEFENAFYFTSELNVYFFVYKKGRS